MAFFDNFTKKVTEATQSVTQKGKDFAETAKLNQALSEEEKRLEEHYKVIGKLFVETIGDKVEGEFAIYVANVRATEAKIAELKEQIKQLENELADAQANIEMFMGQAEKGEYNGIKVSFKTQERKTFDRKAYEAERGEIPQKYFKVSTSRPFKVTAKKG